jgi:hypothetical protein
MDVAVCLCRGKGQTVSRQLGRGAGALASRPKYLWMISLGQEYNETEWPLPSSPSYELVLPSESPARLHWRLDNPSVTILEKGLP